MRERTVRQRIIRLIETRSAFISEIADIVSERGNEYSPDSIIRQIQEINKSLDDRQVLVRPPYCKSCGFDEYDNVLNIPRKCPECYSTWIQEPEVKIDGESE